MTANLKLVPPLPPAPTVLGHCTVCHRGAWLVANIVQHAHGEPDGLCQRCRDGR